MWPSYYCCIKAIQYHSIKYVYVEFTKIQCKNDNYDCSWGIAKGLCDRTLLMFYMVSNHPMLSTLTYFSLSHCKCVRRFLSGQMKIRYMKTNIYNKLQHMIKGCLRMIKTMLNCIKSINMKNSQMYLVIIRFDSLSFIKIKNA